MGAYREEIAEQLYTRMLSRRFFELTQKPDAPFLNATSTTGLFVRATEAFILNAMVKEDGIDRGLETMLAESARAARFGFTATELERQKRDLLRSLERQFTERDKQESALYAEEYVCNFTQREPMPGIAYEYELHKRFLPEITLDEINRLGKDWASEKNRVVLVNAPEKEGLKTPDEARLASVIKGAAAKEIQPYVDTVSNQALLDNLPRPGKIIKTASKEVSGITEWELSNGVKVVLKPTNFKQDEVVFRALSPGGTSLASDQDFIPAITAAQVLSAGGIGEFSTVELEKILSGKVAVVRPMIGETEEGLSGSASPKDLETMFQLIYLTFTQPRPDAAIFGVVTARMKAMLANQKASPSYAFNETLQTTLSQNHYRARPMTPEMIDGMSLEKSLAFYNERFADAGDFTFVFVGNIDLSALRPLVEQYLGSLPSLHRNETWKDVGIRPPKGVVQKIVKKGIEPKSQTAIVFTGEFQHDPAHRVAIRALSMVLETKLRETLREDLSGTYGVSVSAGYSKVPVERYNLSIGFGCNPERAEELIKVIFREIGDLRDKGPSEKQVNDVKEGLLREYETNAKQNSYLLTQIYFRYQVSEDMKGFYAVPELYRKLTPAAIQEAARAYLNTENYVQIILLPEK